MISRDAGRIRTTAQCRSFGATTAPILSILSLLIASFHDCRGDQTNWGDYLATQARRVAVSQVIATGTATHVAETEPEPSGAIYGRYYVAIGEVLAGHEFLADSTEVGFVEFTGTMADGASTRTPFAPRIGSAYLFLLSGILAGTGERKLVAPVTPMEGDSIWVSAFDRWLPWTIYSDSLRTLIGRRDALVTASSTAGITGVVATPSLSLDGYERTRSVGVLLQAVHFAPPDASIAVGQVLPISVGKNRYGATPMSCVALEYGDTITAFLTSDAGSWKLAAQVGGTWVHRDNQYYVLVTSSRQQRPRDRYPVLRRTVQEMLDAIENIAR